MKAIPDHWSQVDPGPLTDDERHQRVVRLHAEVESAKAWRDRVTAESKQWVALLERQLRAELNRPATNPTKGPR